MLVVSNNPVSCEKSFMALIFAHESVVGRVVSHILWNMVDANDPN